MIMFWGVILLFIIGVVGLFALITWLGNNNDSQEGKTDTPDNGSS